MMNCDVSILVANYNNARFLKEFLDSIASSTLYPAEVILVDDGSTDDSIKVLDSVVEEYSFDIMVVKLQNNVGFGNALNEGLKYCNSKYILRVDPDDLLHENRILKQYEFMTENPEIDILGTNCLYFTNKGAVGSSNMLKGHEWIKSKYLSGEHGVMHGTVMMKREVLDNNKYIQSNVPAEDYDLFSRLLKSGYRFENLIEPLTQVRIHDSSVSNDLPFSTVKKTFLLRSDIWGVSRSSISIYFMYLSRKLYRRYLFTRKIKFLIGASLLNPAAVIRKILN